MIIMGVARTIRAMCSRRSKCLIPLVILAILAMLTLMKFPDMQTIKITSLNEVHHPAAAVIAVDNSDGKAVEVVMEKRDAANASLATTLLHEHKEEISSVPLVTKKVTLNAVETANVQQVSKNVTLNVVEESNQTVTPSMKPIELGTVCPFQQSCSDEKKPFSFYVQSGLKTDLPPIICFNNELVVGGSIKPARHGRGANVVVVHPKLKKVVDIRIFDLYESVDNCLDMAAYLSSVLSWKAVVLIASMDDMSFSLCKALKTLLTQYGSSKINDVKFRDNWVLVGEKALPGNLGLEKLVSTENKPWPAVAANVSGCISIPMSTKYVTVDSFIGLTLESCGIDTCGFDEVGVHIQTHSAELRYPKVCIAGRYYFYPGVTGGRGFNILVFDPLTRNVKQTVNFDTYKTESSRLALFLESVDSKDFLIVVVSDDSSVSLENSARNLIKKFGFDATEIRMRTALYFVGQKGMQQSHYQKVVQPPSPSQWPAPINERFCLPLELPTGDGGVYKARENFCAKHDGFADFCFVHHKSESLQPTRNTADISKITDIYKTPILVLAGVNNIALSKTLRSLLKQPGLDPARVHVAYSSMFGNDYADFIRLFNFTAIELEPINSYASFITLAFQQFWSLNPDAEYAIVVDDEVISLSGFIWYFGHAMQVMKKDESIAAASAFNPQGFYDVASNSSAIHLVDQFSGLAFLIRKSFYMQEISSKETKCCSQRSILQWFSNGTSQPYKYMIPEVSRATYFSTTAYATQLHPLPKMTFARNRTVVKEDLHGITLDMTSMISFENTVSQDLKEAHFVEQAYMTVCEKESDAAAKIVSFLPEKKVIAIVYKQTSSSDFSTLEKLYPCLGLMYLKGYNPHGVRDGVTSVSLMGRKTYLIGSQSKYHELVEQYKPNIVTF